MPSSRRGIQGIFPIQGSNLCLLRLLHCSLPLSHWTRGHSPKTSAPLSGGPGVELKSSSSLLSQALGSGSSGCPLPEGLTAAFWPLPCCVLWGPDRTPAWFRPSSFRWPWTGRPCSQASQLEPHSWQEVVAAIGMRGGASAPLRPSLPLSSLRIPPRQRQRGGCRATPIPHCHPDPPPPPAPPPLWVLPVPHRRGLLSSEPARPGCLCAGQTGGP